MLSALQANAASACRGGSQTRILRSDVVGTRPSFAIAPEGA